jgi:hypothetical protein
VRLLEHHDPHTPEFIMEKPTLDALTHRLEKLERENRQGKWLAGLSTLVLALSFTLGGFLGSRAVVAQQPQEKAGNPALGPMKYKVTETVYLHQLEAPLQLLADEGWELVQVVTTERPNPVGPDRGVMVVRRPMKPGK